MPEPPDPIGQCRTCRHAQTVRTPRSVFWLCSRSRTEPEFPRYPRLPVRDCPGFEPAPDATPPEAEGPRAAEEGEG